MFEPDKYPGLDDYYEENHRAVLVERGEVPPLLRLRGHNPNEALIYDRRYEPYYKRMDLLQFVLNFKGTPPWMNSTAITALTDRWRPETHSFHLPLGEMTITLEDIAMISGLPIDGRALTGKVKSRGWRQRVAGLVGVEPEPWTHETQKDPRPSGVLFSWIRSYFYECPRDASPALVEKYARAYLWNLWTQVVFPDGTGDTASWMFLDPLRDWDVKWSWGSAALAFLYRQLDGACRRSKPKSCLGGFVWALQIWMWERIPVGRSVTVAPMEPWPWRFNGDEERYPTIAYTWSSVEVSSVPSMGRYKAYISELDMLTYNQVNWRPYTVMRQFPLNNMCLRDRQLWRVRCPMICFYAVEWHLPHRVAKQFGVQQQTPPDYVETSVKLHRMSRQNNKNVTNWEDHHIMWVDMWNVQRTDRVETDHTPDHDEQAYLRHLEWLRREYRLIHKGAWTRADCLDLMPSDAADGAFNNSVRETIGGHLEYAPLHDRVGTELWRCINDGNVVLSHPPGPEADGLVRSTLQKVLTRCRTLAALLSCHGASSTDVRARAPLRVDIPSSSRARASSGGARGSSSRARSYVSGARPSSRRARNVDPEEEIEEEEEETEEDERNDPDFTELGASQMEDAPHPSQPSQEVRRASTRTIQRPKWQNTPEGYGNKGKTQPKRGRK